VLPFPKKDKLQKVIADCWVYLNWKSGYTGTLG
jgi:hypothetical protein